MTSVTAHSTTTRRTTTRAARGVPWRTVGVLAVVLAYADGYWLVSVQGAVGAVGRTDHQFLTWLRESTVILPAFAFVVLAALTLAAHWFGSTPERARTAIATALLVVLGSTAVGMAAIVANSVFDYHVQSAGLRFMQAMPSMHGRCDSNCLAQQQRESLAVLVRGVLVVSRWVVLTNLVLVAWIVALLGGRLRLGAVRRRHLTQTDARHLLVVSLVASAAIHVAVIPEHVVEWRAAGLFFASLTAGELFVAGALLARPRRPDVLYAAAAISIGPLLLWLYSRTIGLPFGPEPGAPEGVGVPDCMACALEVISLVAVVLLLRPRRWLARRPSASTHVRGLAALALVSVTVIGVATTGLGWFDAFDVSSSQSTTGTGH
jgi:hypothetical protein